MLCITAAVNLMWLFKSMGPGEMFWSQLYSIGPILNCHLLLVTCHRHKPLSPLQSHYSLIVPIPAAVEGSLLRVRFALYVMYWKNRKPTHMAFFQVTEASKTHKKMHVKAVGSLMCVTNQQV